MVPGAQHGGVREPAGETYFKNRQASKMKKKEHVICNKVSIHQVNMQYQRLHTDFEVNKHK